MWRSQGQCQIPGLSSMSSIHGLVHGCVVFNIAATPQGGSELFPARQGYEGNRIIRFAHSLIPSLCCRNPPRGFLQYHIGNAYWTGVTMRLNCRHSYDGSREGVGVIGWRWRSLILWAPQAAWNGIKKNSLKNYCTERRIMMHTAQENDAKCAGNRCTERRHTHRNRLCINVPNGLYLNNI